MNRVTHIHAATDLSEPAGQAVERAALLAKAQEAQLELIHIVSEPALESLRSLFRKTPEMPERLVADVRQLLEEQVTNLADRFEITATSRVVVGQVLDEVLATCATTDLLVVGAHGLNWVRDAILGTTAERLLGKCQGPILVVKRPPASAYRNVLVAVDLSVCSENALHAAIQLAPHAHITVAHAFEVPLEGQLRRAGVTETVIENLRNQEKQKTIETIREMIYRAGDPSQHIDFVVEHGHALRMILAKEEALDADLIVVCKRARPVVEAWLLGSVTRHVLSDANCDVLVVQ